MKPILLCTLLLFTIGRLAAQPVKSNNQTTLQKFKPPKVMSYWGIRKDSTGISVDEALQLLAIPIRVTDVNNNIYSISSYQFVYRKIGIIEDEETGKTHLSSTISAQQFRITPLPEIWIKSISEQLKAGEELNFFDVVVKDNHGHLFFAPTIKIKII